MQRKFSVGQVLFVIMRGKQSITPVQVVEENTRTTLEGTVTSHTVRSLLPQHEQQFKLSDERVSDVFTSADAMRTELTRRASESIAVLCAEAVEAAQGAQRSAASDPSPVDELDDPTPDVGAGVRTVPVTLPDGSRVEMVVN